MSINKLLIFFLFGTIGCHDTGPDPIDNPNPIDTIEIFIGDYLGACYLYHKIFSSETGITTYERDTVYDFPVSVTIDTMNEGNFFITVENNFLFYPYKFFITKEEFAADTIRANTNQGVYWTDLILVRPDTSMIVNHITADVSGPGFKKCDCHFRKNG